MKVDDQRHAPVAHPQKRDPVPILQETGWAQSQSRWVGKNSPPPSPTPGFDLWIVQTVASRYTNYAIPAHNNNNNNNNK